MSDENVETHEPSQASSAEKNLNLTGSTQDEAATPKPRRRRRTKAEMEAARAEAAAQKAAAAEAAEEPKPRRRPGRPKGSTNKKKAATNAEGTTAAAADEPVKPRRRRRTKAEIAADKAKAQQSSVPTEGTSAPSRMRQDMLDQQALVLEEARRAAQAANATNFAAAQATQANQPTQPAQATPATQGAQTTLESAGKPAPRRRGRPRKNPLPEPAETTATKGISSEPTQLSLIEQAAQNTAATHLTRIPALPTGTQAQNQSETQPLPTTQTAQPTTQASADKNESSDTQNATSERSSRQEAGYKKYRRANKNAGDQHESQAFDRKERNNRRNKRQEAPSEPTLSREELSGWKVAQLREKAAELDKDPTGVRKHELVELVYEAAARAEGFRKIKGILEIQPEGYGFIRCQNYMKGPEDAFVYLQLIRSLGLRSGDEIEGSVVPGRSNSKYPPLGKVELINGRAPELAKRRPKFRDLTPIYPNEPLRLEHGKESYTGRAIDLVAPIGKGQRGLIVSPPKAGKTTILKRICESIAANNPEVHLICLLVDERPEEVTDMQRSIKGEVVASTFDMPASNHTAVAELVIERAKRLVEQGEDVVVMLDSITRLARAYNLAAPASGRILSGGVDSAALYPPKRFLGAARNIEGGGSLTIIASALIDTGSKMDEVIFEEFKGTGNMELKLDRELADKRIFPAIDPVASGTRNEDLLIDPEYQPFVWGIRRILANMNNTERAEASLIKSLKATNDNKEFLIRSAKKAQAAEYTDSL